MDIPMNKEQYAISWEAESNSLENNGIYKKLVDLLPDGKVLEIGCGNGMGTHWLSQKHDVLSLDNNEYLIKKTKEYLNSQNDKYQIHKCDLFKLTKEDNEVIKKFKPNIIVAWFIGGAGENVNKYIKEGTSLGEKVKLYRERIEDIIVSDSILTDSVEIINFAIRVAIPSNISNEYLSDEQKKEYDTYVFKNTNFGVNDVSRIKWDIDKSSFRYSMSKYQNISEGSELTPTVISISAKKLNIKLL